MIVILLFKARARIPPGHVFISVGLWVCGFVGVWVCRFVRLVGLSVYSYVGLSFCGFVGVWGCGGGRVSIKESERGDLNLFEHRCQH